MHRFSQHCGYSNSFGFVAYIVMVGLLTRGLPLWGQELTLAMPFPATKVVRCSQGPGGTFSHIGDKSRHDFDFAAGEGTPVTAAEGGTAHVFSDIPDPSFRPQRLPHCDV